MELIIVVILPVSQLSGHFKAVLAWWWSENGPVNEKVTGPMPTTVHVCFTAEEDIKVALAAGSEAHHAYTSISEEYAKEERKKEKNTPHYAALLHMVIHRW